MESSQMSYARALKDILSLSHEPIGVTFLKERIYPEGFEVPSARRYCQILMGAGQGKRYLLSADNIACPAAAWALGFKAPPVQLSSGAMPAEMGIFGSREAARKTLESMPRLEMGQYQMVACYPLGDSSLNPDVVVVESDVEHLMWVALADVFETGGRLEFSTGILQATCVDGTIIPFLDRRLHASLGCYGCREATDLATGESVIGFPASDLERIVNSLERLNQRAIPRVRGKTIYNALLQR